MLYYKLCLQYNIYNIP